MVASASVLIALCTLSHVIPPPPSLPDIFPVLISSFSCLLFMLTLLYFSYVQVSLPAGSGGLGGTYWMYQRNIQLKISKKLN